MTEWYKSMDSAWRAWHSAYTDSFANPLNLVRGGSISQPSGEEVSLDCDADEQNTEVDPQLGMILCKLYECKDQDSLKTYLLDVEAYQNGKSIEEVVTQKALLGLLLA